jgi:hypothetical protein
LIAENIKQRIQSLFNDGVRATLSHLLKIDEDNARGLDDLSSISESLTDTGISLALTEYVLERLKVKWIRVRAGASYRMRLHRLGLLKHISGSEAVPGGSWEDPSQFVIDEKGLAELKKEALGASRTLRSIFEAVRTSIGVRAGLIRHKTLATSITFAELCQPENFQETEEYAKFLSSEKLEEEPDERHPALECLTVKSGLTV